MAEAKVEFGLSNIYYAPYEDGKYGTPVHVPGAVSLSMDPTGDSSTFYADNIGYYVTRGASGKSGTITIARATVALLSDILGFETDENGVAVEFSDAAAKEFALLYQVQTDASALKFALFNCSLGNKKDSHNTQSESTDPDTQEYDITAAARTFTFGGTDRAILGAFCESTSSAYADWFTKVYTPTKAGA